VLYTVALEQISTSFLLKTKKIKQYIKIYELKLALETSLPLMRNFTSHNHNTKINAFTYLQLLYNLHYFLYFNLLSTYKC